VSRPGIGALGALLLGACASTAGGEARGAAEPGERLYRAHCASCHRLRDPAEHSAEEWARLVPRYGARAHLAPAEERAVLRWLEARARR